MNGFWIAISSIFLYTSFSLLVLFYAFVAYRNVISENRLSQKFSLFGTAFVAVMYSLLNVFCTYFSNGYGGDRRNYYYNYEHGRVSGFDGFDLLFQSLKQVLDNYELILYLITFLVVLTVILIYKFSNQATPYSLMFLFASNLVFFSFTGLKQSLGCIFANIFFALELSTRKNTLWSLLSLLLIVLSCYFHSTCFVLFLVFILLRINYKNRNMATLVAVMLFIFTLILMKPVSLLLSSRIEGLMPQISTTINTYFDDSEYSEGILQVFRGIPFYLLSFYAFKYRKKYCELIPNYDKYLVISVLGSSLYMYSAVSYWYSRFIIVFYIPLAFLFGQLVWNLNKDRQEHHMIFMIIGSLYFFTMRNLYMVFTIYGAF